MFDLMKAVYSWWVASGLEESIAKLYPAGEGKGSGQNRTGSPAGTECPRAEYHVVNPAPTVKTRNSRIAQAVVTINVWDKARSGSDGSSLVAHHVQSIRAAFVNADESGMVMGNGDILEVDDGGSMVGKADEELFVGVQTLLIRHRIDNRAP